MSWFGEARAAVELKKTRLALERIARVLEAVYIGNAEKGSGFTSLYKDDSEGYDGEVVNVTDADYAEMERMEREREQAGGQVGMDEPLLKGRGRWEEE